MLVAKDYDCQYELVIFPIVQYGEHPPDLKSILREFIDWGML